MTPEKTTVVLLAAGRGSRMRELTKDTPKPLLKVGKHSLIEHHLINLNALGFRHVVINTAYLGDKIRNRLSDGTNFGLNISYSDESSTGALETAGGLRQALSLIKSDPFIAINADIYTDFLLTNLLHPITSKSDYLGRLVLVENPSHNPSGDFVTRGDSKHNTYSGIALYQKSLFAELEQGKQSLGPILKTMVANNQLELLEHFGRWTDVGTPERLTQLNAEIKKTN